MKRVLLFAIVGAVTALCSCDRTVPDNSLQIIQDDVIELDGSFDENFLSGWDYIALDGKETDALISGDVSKVLYDDGLYFISCFNNEGQIKVFDSDGHYLNDISRKGRARNEYLYLEIWTIDRNRNEVLIATQENDEGPVTIKKFNYQGEYLGQSLTAPITDRNIFGNIAKCLSDGTLLVENGIRALPVLYYYYVPQNGPLRYPIEMTDKDFGQLSELVETYGVSSLVNEGYFNPLTDTTYLVRILDNHIYRLTENDTECVANLAFRPNPDNIKKFSKPSDFRDMKDYLYISYFEYNCVFEKSTSKVYVVNRKSRKRMLPDYCECSLYGNDMIACVDVDEITRANERIESDDYNHEYSPEVEDFYRKVKGHGNPVIFIAHYDKTPTPRP